MKELINGLQPKPKLSLIPSGERITKERDWSTVRVGTATKGGAGCARLGQEGGAECARLPGELEGGPWGREYMVVSMTFHSGGSE